MYTTDDPELQNLASGVSPFGRSSGVDVISVTPNDSADLAFVARALRTTTAGNVVIKTLAGQQRTLAFEAGETRAVAALRVYATSTTATGIEAIK